MSRHTLGARVLWVLRMLQFFLGHFPRKLVVACFDVAWDVLRPQHRFTQGIVEFRSRCATDLEIYLMASLILLTPGTLTLAVSRGQQGEQAEQGEPSVLYVHTMYCENREDVLEELRDYEYRMLRAVRVDGVVPPPLSSEPSSRSGGGAQ